MKRILLVLFGCATAPAASLWWGPYLQNVSRTEATIMWAARGEGGGAVRLRGGGSAERVESRVLALTPPVTQLEETLYLHRAEVTGLTPGALHYYQVILEGRPASPESSFRTAGDGPFRFLVFADSGDGRETQRKLAALIEKEQADLVIHAGDIAYWEGRFQQYADTFFAIYPSLLARTPLFTAPGNHDYPGDALAYRQVFSLPRTGVPPEGWQRYYSFDWGNTHFTAIDTNTPLEAVEQGDRTMIEWLDRDLEATRQTWRIVYFHHPPFPSTPYKIDDPNCALALRHLTPVLERHGVHLVIAGHEHIYQRTRSRRGGRFQDHDRGTTYLTAGGAGSQIYDSGTGAFIANATGASHYLRIDVNGSRLDGEAIGFGPEPIDRWSLTAAPLLPEPAAVDAAAFAPAIAPGGLVSIFGWNLAAAAGDAASVRIDGTGIPVLFASRLQINAQLPFDVGAEAEIEVTTREGTARQRIQARRTAPAIFTSAHQDLRLAVATHADGRRVSELDPAVPGERIDLFVTGLGRVRGAIRVGEPPPETPPLDVEAEVRAQAGGTGAEVVRTRLAPGLVGMYRITIAIPEGIDSGWMTIQVSANGAMSNSPVIPVKRR